VRAEQAESELESVGREAAAVGRGWWPRLAGDSQSTAAD